MHSQTVLVRDRARDLASDHSDTAIVTAASHDAVAERLALLRLAEALGSVAQACRLTGFSRGTFYRMKERYATGGEAGLRAVERRGRVPKNRFDASIETLVVELALAHPTWGRRRFVALLAERGVTISASGVRCIWKRHGLLSARRPEATRPQQCRVDAAS